MKSWKSYFPLLFALLLALVLKLILVLADAVPFNSDEAIVALAARHILQEARPVFFYGQAYMGTIDSYMIALAFRFFGESVLVMRLIEILLYLLFIISLWGLARRIFVDARIANFSVLLAAIPPVLISTYTTAYYGTYGETILLGNVILWLGYEIIYGKWQRSPLAWSVLGAVSGIAFWTFGLIGVYILPIALLGLWKHRTALWKYYLVCSAGFLAGSWPWWLYNLQNNWEALFALTRPNYAGSSFIERMFSLFLFNIPALIGIRFPWRPDYLVLPLALFILMLYVLALSNLIVTWRSRSLDLSSGAGAVLQVFVSINILVLLTTGFGLEITGRYFLPLFVPLVFMVGIWLSQVWAKKKPAAVILFIMFLAANLLGTWLAANSPDRITTQLDPRSSFDNQYDQALIDFLEERDLQYGYTNYWVTYRLAFLSGEKLIFSPELPYKESLSYTVDDIRIPQYAQLADQSQEIALITTKHPELDRILKDRLSQLGIEFNEEQIGPYHIFFDLSERVFPEDLGYGG